MAAGLVGAVLMVVGAIGSGLAWATASTGLFTVSAGGFSGDGKITIVAALLGLVFFVIGIVGRAKWPFSAALVMSLIVAGVGIYDAANLGSGVSVGIGLWLVMAAGVVGFFAAIAGLAAPRELS